MESLDRISIGSIPDGSAILCRNNAPLFSLALRLLRAGRGVHLVGTELGPSLVKTLKKLGLETLTRDEVLSAIDAWEEDKKAKSKAKATIADKADCLRVFARFGATLGEAIVYCESNPPELSEDYAREEALMEATGMNDPDYWKTGKRRLLTPQERARLNRL